MQEPTPPRTAQDAPQQVDKEESILMAEDRKPREESSRQTRATIDRVEDGGFAVLYLGEDEKTKVDFPVSLLPKGAAEGDHLRITITIDRASHDEATARVRKLQEELKAQSGTDDKKDFKL
jgi:hypothetical protein